MEEIKRILFEGSVAERRHLFAFDRTTSAEDMVQKFDLWSRFFFPKFFTCKDAEFHHEMLIKTAMLYRGDTPSDEFLNIGFRGCSKTTFTKLFIVFILANDKEHSRKYYKILSSDGNNSKQMVTDIYNMLIGPRMMEHYPELFTKSDQKRQETMEVIDFATGVKVKAGTVGQVQRGNVQGSEEASRPDFLVFDDIETKDSLRSAVKTRAIWDSMQEAIDGLAKGGITLYLANYVSERGNIHRLVERSKFKLIAPIWDENEVPTWPDKFTHADIVKIRDKADDFPGEYLCKPSASKDVMFDRESIDRQVPKKPVKESAGFKMFKEYNPSHRVAGGADVAGGLGLDSSASVFIDFDYFPAQVVGTYHNNEIKPDDFGHELARQGDFYGQCLLAPENNKYDECIGILKLIYPISRIFATQKNIHSKINFATPTTFGWNTNSLTKTQMINALAKAIEQGLLDLNDEQLIREARSYTRNDVLDGEVDPRMATRHFDLLMACAIAWQMKDYAAKGSKKKEYDPFEEIFNQRKAEAGGGNDHAYE